MMYAYPLRAAALALTAIGLSACAMPYGSGVSVGVGNQYDPYYGSYGYPAYGYGRYGGYPGYGYGGYPGYYGYGGYPGAGWYSGYYYPGYGDYWWRDGRRYRIPDEDKRSFLEAIRAKRPDAGTTSQAQGDSVVQQQSKPRSVTSAIRERRAAQPRSVRQESRSERPTTRERGGSFISRIRERGSNSDE